jgi:uncharacterized protein YegP (UPF0339 family)
MMAAGFTVYKDTDGHYRWRLQAKNGKVIADSGEGYVRKAACLRGIELVADLSFDAPIDDKTISE